MGIDSLILDADSFFPKEQLPLGGMSDDLFPAEYNWQWPEELGDGNMSVVAIQPGLVLGIGKYCLHQDVSMRFAMDNPPFCIGFSLSSDMYGKREDGQPGSLYFQQGETCLFYLPQWNFIAPFKASSHVRSVGIYIDPEKLKAFLDKEVYEAIISGECYNINPDGIKGYYRKLRMPAHSQTAIHQLLNCPYRPPLRQWFMESKVIELVVHSLSCLSSQKKKGGAGLWLKNDTDRIREARAVLISHMDCPPSLFELAKQVGINKNKLNSGFRHVFGMSVFDYLRVQRLEKAKSLLANKEMNVTETAFEVGYQNPRSFSRAFTQHFGTNPKYFLR